MAKSSKSAGHGTVSCSAVDDHPQRADDTLVVEHPFGLSFFQRRRDRRGHLVDECAFTAPAQSFDQAADALTGVDLAREFLQWLRDEAQQPKSATGLRDHVARAVLQEAFRAQHETRLEPSRHGAAWEFVDDMLAMVQFAAQHCDWPAFLQRRAERARASAAWWEQKSQQRREAHLQQLAQARSAKAEKAAARRAAAAAAPVVAMIPTKPARIRRRADKAPLDCVVAARKPSQEAHAR